MYQLLSWLSAVIRARSFEPLVNSSMLHTGIGAKTLGTNHNRVPHLQEIGNDWALRKSDTHVALSTSVLG